MDERKVKCPAHPNSTVQQSIGRVFEWLGILFFLGPGLTLLLIGVVGSFSDTDDPAIRDLVPSAGLICLGVVLLIFAGLVLYYFLHGERG